MKFEPDTIFVLVAATLIGAACGTPRPSVAPHGTDVCTVDSASPSIDSASVVLTSPVDVKNAPHPTSWGERFLFRLAYDTSTGVDCRGRPMPKHAGSYTVFDGGRSTFILEPSSGARLPRLTIRAVTDTNARDLIDADPDLLLTETPALAEYAARRANVMSFPLGFTRTWVAVTSLPGGLGLDSSSSLRADLARDVVPAEARVPEGPAWWVNSRECQVPGTPRDVEPVQAPRSSRVVYPRDEPIARALAERLVALVGAGTVAIGLAPNAFALALRSGTELAYIFPLQRIPVDRCAALIELSAAAPWLAKTSSEQVAVTPLVETRLRAVFRRHRLNLSFTPDSSVTITPAQP